MSADPLNVEVRVPTTEAPGFLDTTFFERKADGSVWVGVLMKGSVCAYAYSTLTPEHFWQIADALFPEGRPADVDATLRRDGH